MLNEVVLTESVSAEGVSAQRRLRIALVAGEVSGDMLGSSLMQQLHVRFPDAEFVGIGGAGMIAAGLHSYYPMERLSVMGLFEVLGRLRELLRLRRELAERLIAQKPDVFIGIDAPDFNLGLEKRLHDAGIRTVHYVSPSVWAWRQGRVKTIAAAVDHMLALLPFEAGFYQQHQVPVTFVGHPLADLIPLQSDITAAREALALDAGARVLAVLPGSRGGEVKYLLPVFIDAMRLLAVQFPGMQFLLPAANAARREQIQQLLQAKAADIPGVQVIDGRSREVMTAADSVLLASGTATLEAMLLKKPMVAAYRFHPLTYAILSRLVKSASVLLPNLLAGEALVPELLQNAATGESLAAAVQKQWQMPADEQQALQQRYATLHQQLRCNASVVAAEAIAGVMLSPQDAHDAGCV